MHAILFLIASMVVLAAFGAVLLRNLVHCALCLALTFAGLAALYLRLGAQFEVRVLMENALGKRRWTWLVAAARAAGK